MTQLDVIEIGLADLVHYPDAIFDIYRGAIDVMIVRNVFAAEQVQGIVSRLEVCDAEMDWTPQEDPDPTVRQMRLIGKALTPYVHHPEGPDLDEYFAAAERLKHTVQRLFAGGHDFEGHILQTLARISGDREVTVPRHSDGRRYTPATIRSLPTGTAIPLHVGNFFLGTAGYRHLSTMVSLIDQLSYFVTLAPATSGGELVVYPLQWGDPETPMRSNGIWDEEAICSTYEGQRFRPGVGDLLLFDGGRYYHRVSRIQSPKARWTIGGFIGFSRDMRTVHIWN